MCYFSFYGKKATNIFRWYFFSFRRKNVKFMESIYTSIFLHIHTLVLLSDHDHELFKILNKKEFFIKHITSRWWNVHSKLLTKCYKYINFLYFIRLWVKHSLLFALFYIKENGGLKRLRNKCKVTQLVRARSQTV